MRHEAVPAGVQNSTPVMEEFGISVNGILKFLQNLKPNKAAGPDRLKSILPQLSKLFLSVLSRQASSQQTGGEPKLRQSLRRIKSRQLLTIDQYPWLAYFSRSSSILWLQTHLKRSLSCWSRNFPGVWVEASKLIWYCWTFQRPLIK